MTLIERYRRLVSDGEIDDDPSQSDALTRLERLRCALVGATSGFPGPGVLRRILGRRVAASPQGGIYLHGGVGVGKSMLMDLFFDAAPTIPKRRVHFHAFMQDVHANLHQLRESGMRNRDPLVPVASAIARSAQLLCLDEMQINDIADAMIVGRLFEQFFDAGMTIVTTSNQAPDDLYPDGLNRQLFLPFVALLKDRLDVVGIDSDTDHRRLRLRGEQRYFWPNDDAAARAIEAIWRGLTGGHSDPLALRNKGRDILIPAFHNGIARACFTDLCRSSLGPGDLLLVAASVRLLLLTDIPRMSDADRDPARRFVTLVDALYESKVPLIATAAAAPERLYTVGRGAFEFRRTASRLVEMQSEDWFNGRNR